MEPPIRVTLIGGTLLTRDLFSHILTEAGIQVSEGQPTLNESGEVALVIADHGEPSRLLLECTARRSVVVADVEVDDNAVVDLVLEGADAVLGFGTSAQELVDAVRTVSAGGSVLGPRSIRRLSEIARSSRVVTTPERALLTSREIDILLSIGRGESVKQTARGLGISAKTVENLQSRLFRKLDVRNRAQAFAQAHAMGLLPPAALANGHEIDITATRSETND